jgi:hypothetical protein
VQASINGEPLMDKLRRTALLAFAFGSMAASQAAAPPPFFTLNQQSGAQFSSALYTVPQALSDQNANSLAAWDAMGRHAHTGVEIVPVQPDGFRFEQDLATAWTDLVQPASGADATLRSYARLSGYYFNGGNSNGAGNHVQLHQSVSVENRGTGAYFNLISTTHGTLLAGGLSNAVTASAQEQTTYIGLCLSRCYEVDQVTPLSGIGGTWAGAATVVASDSTPTISVTGAWTGQSSAFSRSVPGFTDPFHGVELKVLLGSQSVYLAGGASMIIDVDFEGSYGAASGSGTGFLSFGEADFSGTGLLGFSALDAVTGLPTRDVSFTVMSSPVPAPPTAALLAAGLLLIGLQLRQQRAAIRRQL